MGSLARDIAERIVDNSVTTEPGLLIFIENAEKRWAEGEGGGNGDFQSDADTPT